MNRRILGIIFVFGLLFSGCSLISIKPTAPTAHPTVPATVATPPPETTVPSTTAPAVTEPLHSEFYIPGLDVEDVILHFNQRM